LDVRNWASAIDYERGESVRRRYIDQMREHADIAAGIRVGALVYTIAML